MAIHKKLYSELNFIMMLCFKHNGFIFGGFVRDYIIQKKLDRNKKFYKNIDIWFRKEDNLTSFLKEIKYYVHISNKNIYSNERYIKFKIFLSEKIPTDDFNVNACYYDGESVFIPDEQKLENFILAYKQKKCVKSEKIRIYDSKKIYKSKNPFLYKTILGFPIITKILLSVSDRTKYMKKMGWTICENYDDDYFEKNMKKIYKYIDKRIEEQNVYEKTINKFLLDEETKLKIHTYIFSKI